MSTDADIVIAGGGMVGGTLAALIAAACGDNAPRIRVIEPHPFDAAKHNDNPSFDQRSTALALSAVHVLERAKLWQAVHERACVIDSIHVSDRGHFGSMLMQAKEDNLPALGYVVENRHLGHAIMMGQAQFPAVQWQTGRVTAAKVGSDCVTLQVDEASLTARLLIVADGARSALREQLGIRVDHTDYAQRAIIANIATEQSHQGRAFERFTDQGPLAMLPLPDAEGWHRSALVWTLPPQEAEATLALPEEQFLARLQERFGYRLGKLLKVGERASYPLSRSHACEQVRPRMALVGNAAHALHPVAGQGFNLALRDIAVLSDCIARAWQAGDPGSLNALQQYLDAQLADQQRTADFSEGITRVFTARNPLASRLRGLGLLALDVLPALKKTFVRETTGIGKHHPGWKGKTP
ncbi:MAG TPA: 2-octaprenyl-6-methoxyphenyl hydroxylase [Pseudomonadales bacterium]